mgnify:CR=1 FL=1
MKKILILVVFALIGGGLYANSERVLSKGEGKLIVTDTVKGNVDLQKVLQAAMASGQMPKFRLTQTITPVNVSSTNKHVKINAYVLNDSACVVQLDVSGCKGKLTGIDTSAYLQACNKIYKIKSVKEAKLPVDSKVTMTWDAKKEVINLVFPGVKIVPNEWDWELVLSKAKNGVRVKTRFEKR